LTDATLLGHEFRQHYLHGLRRLLENGQLKLGGCVDFLRDTHAWQRWLRQLEAIDWNVFVQGPPQGKSDPANVVKYLARYLTGGPIADRRLIRFCEKEVWFWARPKRSTKRLKKGMNPPEPFRLSGSQFMQRWTLHILPKGFTRSRQYGGYHGTKRAKYINQCRELLGSANEAAVPSPLAVDPDKPSEPQCPQCESVLLLIQSQRRPSWREIFAQDIYPTRIDSPQPPVGTGRSPPREGSAT
jgi:hypothetical protein